MSRVESLIENIQLAVPKDKVSLTEFRADLAGLLVVSIAACYESCVKEIIVDFAHHHHQGFGNYASKAYSKINSRVGVKDLNRYSKIFHENCNAEFKSILRQRSFKIKERTGVQIEKCYENLLEWRHDFAHAGIRNTTVEEAARMHLFAKRVVYCFADAFEKTKPA